MAIRCRDILQLPPLKDMKVVAGHDALDRVIRWVHVADVPHVVHWVQGGELLFITGLGIKSDLSALLDLVKAIEAKKLAGLVINLGPYIKEIPQQVIDLANMIHFPVFELPWEVKLVDVTQAICSAIVTEQIEEKSSHHLLEDILFGEIDSPENIINRAAFHGFDLTKPCQVFVIDIDDFAGYLKKKGTTDERRVLELKNYFKQVIAGVLDKYNKKALSILRSDSVILLLSIDEKRDVMDVKSLAEEIRESVAKHIPGLTVSIGLGSRYGELRDMKKSLNEAELALKVAKCFSDKNSIYSYNELGIYRLLFKIKDFKDLESFYLEMLGALLEYDRLYQSQLVETLDAYIAENRNFLKTAERLHIHRNTLKYRLKRIEEISRRSLQNSYDCLNFQIGLIIGKFIHLSN